MKFHPSMLNLCLWVFFLTLQCHLCLGCVDEERVALLDFKAAVLSPFTDPFLTWVEDETSDCCSWERVMCHHTTHRVNQLSLEFIYNYNFLSNNSPHLLNASLFLPFKDLEYLDISGNSIDGWLNHQGFERLSKLEKLEVLKLRMNSFSNSNVLAPLSKLTSLKTLDLGGNRIGEGPWSEISQGFEKLTKLKQLEDLLLDFNLFNSNVLAPLSKLPSLKTLYLGDNHIGEGPWSEISQGFEKLSNLKKLEVLYLAANSFNNSNVLAPLSKLTSLKTLDLEGNDIGVGPSLDKGFCELKNLQRINLQNNHLRGIIPSCLKNFTSLRSFDLSHNQLSGNIPPSLTSNMAYLRTMDLSENQLIGSIPPSLLFNLTSVEMVSLSNNHLEGTTFIASLYDQKVHLKILRLSNCNINTSTEELAKIFHRQHNLRNIELSNNNIHGNFPVWLAQNNTWLKFLFLENNLISGHVHFSVHSPNLIMIDISNNQIEGHLQKTIGDNLPKVGYLNFSSNILEGKIPTSLGNMTNLQYLDLSNNRFKEEIPETLALLQSLSFLVLSNNKLHGRISPFLFFNNTSLLTLHLSNNQFSGFFPVPNDYNIVRPKLDFPLGIVDLSWNNISGRFPTWIANITWVTSLILGDNCFEGSIPLELCNLPPFLKVLDLSQNGFLGSIPSCLNLSSLRYMQLQGNQLTGPLPHAILNSVDLITLNLNNNKLSGNIPSWLGSLQNIRNLLLNGNRLSGLVPHELCQLKKIGIMDLSNNLFFGTIPSCFNNMAFGKNGTFEEENYDHIGGFSVGLVYERNASHDVIEDNSGSAIVEGNAGRAEVDIMTKSRSSSYQGNIIKFMAGVDLSCNHFTGSIPHEFGALTAIRALNLSYNQLTGSIPKSLSKMKQLESMDVSHNKLSGEIPSELIDITTLAVFSVAYNNLSGRLPDTKAQFGTFSDTSYEGNPFLCGPPLQKQCGDTTTTTGPDTVSFAGLSEKFGVDPISFIASSVVACITSLLALVIVLYINPYWRRMWFDLIDACLSTVFPFWSEAFYRVSNPFT